jgi:hypothetical protein
MRRPRVRIGGAMLLVAVVAAECGLIRLSYTANDVVVAVASAGVLLIANVLALGVFRLATTRESRRPFLLGFVVHGLVAMAAFLAGMWLLGVELVDRIFRVCGPIFTALERALPGPMLESAWLSGAIGTAMLTILLGLPMLGYAALGGLLCSLVARVAVPARTTDQASEGGPGE